MFEEELFPDQVCLLRFRHGPELLVGDVDVAESLGHEVMVDQEIVDAPEQEILERRVVEVGVNVRDGNGQDDRLDLFG